MDGGVGDLRQVFTGMGPVTVNLHCPRFEAEQTSSMVDVLKSLGVREAFIDTARFDRMAAVPVYVSVRDSSCSPPLRNEKHAHPRSHTCTHTRCLTAVAYTHSCHTAVACTHALSHCCCALRLSLCGWCRVSLRCRRSGSCIARV